MAIAADLDRFVAIQDLAPEASSDWGNVTASNFWPPLRAIPKIHIANTIVNARAWAILKTSKYFGPNPIHNPQLSA
jgi:hypothetical protein